LKLTGKWRSVVGTFSPGSKVPRFESCSYPPNHLITTCSPVQLDWFIKQWVVCGLPEIPAHLDPLGSFEKRVGESPWSRASYSGWSLNHWASMTPNRSESRGISLVLGYQFWPKLESLGLNGTQPQLFFLV
jgi:hypothetical protein